MTKLRIALEWFLNPDHLPLLAARQELRADGLDVELIVPDEHYDGFAGLADGTVDLVVNEPLHLVERRDLPLKAHGCFFATEGGVLIMRAALGRLAQGETVRIASPVSTALTDRLCADILAGRLSSMGLQLSPNQVRIEPAGFSHVDNLVDGYDGAWLAFANVEGVDARMRGLDVEMVTTAEAGIPNFSALEIIGPADAAPELGEKISRLLTTLDQVIPALRSDPEAARRLWYEESGEGRSPTTDAIVDDTLDRLVSPVRPTAARWRPMWRYLHQGGGEVVDEAAFEAMF